MKLLFCLTRLKLHYSSLVVCCFVVHHVLVWYVACSFQIICSVESLFGRCKMYLRNALLFYLKSYGILTISIWSIDWLTGVCRCIWTLEFRTVGFWRSSEGKMEEIVLGVPCGSRTLASSGCTTK